MAILPKVKLKALVTFPASVAVQSPILLDTTGGIYTFSLDVLALDSSITIDAGNIVSGTIAAARMPAFTGDITTVAGAVATTLATVNANVGAFGSATQSVQFTTNAKGLLTAAANVTITPAIGSITGLGTGVGTALAVNVGTAGSPVVNGGALGTPSSGTLTNATGLPVGSVTGFGSGIATWLATPSSANLRAALTDEVGTGVAYFVNGALGTPASGTATNLTGLPISTGLTGVGTGVLTALAVNVGSAGAFVTLNGALGTPSSGTLTSATGLPVSTGISGLGTGVATSLGINIGSNNAFVTFNGNLGTPASGTLTNATGLPVSTGLTDTAWTTYTPTSAFATPGTSVMGTANGRWKQIGKVVFFSVDCTVTTVGTAAGTWVIGLPTATNATSLGQTVGASGKEVVTTGALLAIQGASTTTINVAKYDNTSLTLGGNGTRVILLGTYEAA